MRKISLLLFALSLFYSCLDNDENSNFTYEYLPIDEAITPASFTYGETDSITIKYSLPNGCYYFDNLYYQYQDTARIVAVTALVTLDEACTQAITQEEYRFAVKVTQEEDYLFKFWKGQDSQGNNIFEAKCCQQKLAAQSQVYQLFSDKLFAVCLKYSRNYQDAEDTLQDSFLTIFDKIKQYKHKGSFEGWLKRIAMNTALQKYRNTAPLQIVKEVSETDEMVEINFENEDMSIDFLLNLIQQLPDRYRLIFNLYVLDNYSQ